MAAVQEHVDHSKQFVRQYQAPRDRDSQPDMFLVVDRVDGGKIGLSLSGVHLGHHHRGDAMDRQE
jgi:hypothetical protein